VQVLHGGFKPELAIYVRLELLEGLSMLYGGGDKLAARGSLLSAQAKWQQLAVSDDALAQLLSMGFTASEVSGTLRSVLLSTPGSNRRPACCNLDSCNVLCSRTHCNPQPQSVLTDGRHIVGKI
jgi:hypothetical protein